MRILVVSNLYPPFVIGGYELNCRNVVMELRERQYEVLVATSPSHLPGPPDPPFVRRCLNMWDFVPNYAGGTAASVSHHTSHISDFNNVAALHRLLREFEPDIVFFWNLHGVGGLHMIDFLNVHDIPWAIYLGDCVYGRMVNALPTYIRSIFGGEQPDWLMKGTQLAVSQHLVDEIEWMCGFQFPSQPVLVHGYALNADKPFQRGGYRQGGLTRFVTAGRVDEHKGVGLICDAVATLVEEGFKDFEVDIFGAGNVAHYVSQVNSQQTSQYIRFHGSVTQERLLAHYGKCDVFLFPTWVREPFAFAPFEAGAMGCVPFLTANCGCAERIVDGVHGIKIERTVDGLVDAMRRAVQGKIDLERIGRAASQMIREDLSLSGHVDKILACLRASARPWDRTSIESPDVLLLPFVKHHLSLALRFEEKE